MNPTRRLLELVTRPKISAGSLVDLLSLAKVQVLEQHGKPKVLAVDLDDTILRYVRGGGYGAPLPGMIDLLKQLRAEGWKIAIWTCRPNVERVKAKLKEKGVPFDYVNDNPLGKDNDKLRKIQADCYLDDKAITAHGTAAGLLRKMEDSQLQKLVKTCARGEEGASVAVVLASVAVAPSRPSSLPAAPGRPGGPAPAYPLKAPQRPVQPRNGPPAARRPAGPGTRPLGALRRSTPAATGGDYYVS